MVLGGMVWAEAVGDWYAPHSVDAVNIVFYEAVVVIVVALYGVVEGVGPLRFGRLTVRRCHARVSSKANNHRTVRSVLDYFLAEVGFFDVGMLVVGC